MKHPFFMEEPLPISLDSFQTFPSKSENKVLVPTRLPLPAIDKSSGLLPLDKSKQRMLEELEIDADCLSKNGFNLK
jgi:hypothetical protein